MADTKPTLRERILAADDLTRQKVQAWGETFYIRTLTGAERDRWEASNLDTSGKKPRAKLDNVRAKLIALCAVDKGGERLFTDKDAEALGGKSSLELSRLYDVAARLNGISEEDVEELAKN